MESIQAFLKEGLNACKNSYLPFAYVCYYIVLPLDIFSHSLGIVYPTSRNDQLTFVPKWDSTEG